MIEVVEFPYNQALRVWCVLVDGRVFQCFMTEQEAIQAADEMRGAT